MKMFYPAEVAAMEQAYFSQLPEREKRHYCALASLKLGRGGVAYVSSVLPVSRKTILAGKKDLLALATAGAVLEEGRQRKPGAGRKKKMVM
ncbi:hypothetical protein [Parasediminibacterium sp. JCM 36343]|uniref:hypothetical protein n=1 Tax=Parasediminibacterium sp. JCM 36343 TaxID=3374279 RepID=UPI00397ABB9C